MTSEQPQSSSEQATMSDPRSEMTVLPGHWRGTTWVRNSGPGFVVLLKAPSAASEPGQANPNRLHTQCRDNSGPDACKYQPPILHKLQV